LRDAGEAFSA
jgi:hypothetical protein